MQSSSLKGLQSNIGFCYQSASLVIEEEDIEGVQEASVSLAYAKKISIDAASVLVPIYCRNSYFPECRISRMKVRFQIKVQQVKESLEKMHCITITVSRGLYSSVLSHFTPKPRQVRFFIASRCSLSLP